MGLIIDGTTIATSANVYVDGVAMNKVYVDGTLMWTKAAATVTGVKWETCFTGSLMLETYIDQGPEGYGGWECGEVETYYTSMSLSAISSYINKGLIQADAKLLIDIYSTSGAAYGTEHVDSLTANLASTCKTGNLPWTPTYSYVGSELDMPTQAGSGVKQTAYTGWGYDATNNVFGFEYFEVTGLYYGIEQYS